MACACLHAAVFFDLDRTLLRGASGPVITRALRAGRGAVRPGRSPARTSSTGCSTSSARPVPSMMLARQGARFSGGQIRAQVAGGRQGRRRAAASPMVQPYALPSSRSTRPPAARSCWPPPRPTTWSSRSPTPSASTTSSPPATARRRRRLRRHHRRPLRLGPGQARRGARSGPTAQRRRRRATAGPTATASTTCRCSARWPTPSWSTPTPACGSPPPCGAGPSASSTSRAGVPKLVGVEPAEAMLAFARPELIPYARFDIAGTRATSPHEGGAIVVANHRSYFDTPGHGLRHRPGRPPGALPRQEGGLRRPGRRARWPRPWAASGSTGAPAPTSRSRAAAEALEAGEIVVLMPEGTIPRGPAFFDPELKGRWGAAKLAAMAKVAGHPRSGLWGTEQVWPRSARLPNMLNVTDPPLVTDPGRRAGRPEVPVARRRHQADHGGHRRPAARPRPGEPHEPDARGAGPHLPARLHRRPRGRGRPPPRLRHLTVVPSPGA